MLAKAIIDAAHKDGEGNERCPAKSGDVKPGQWAHDIWLYWLKALIRNHRFPPLSAIAGWAMLVRRAVADHTIHRHSHGALAKEAGPRIKSGVTVKFTHQCFLRHPELDPGGNSPVRAMTANYQTPSLHVFL